MRPAANSTQHVNRSNVDRGTSGPWKDCCPATALWAKIKKSTSCKKWRYDCLSRRFCNSFYTSWVESHGFIEATIFRPPFWKDWKYIWKPVSSFFCTVYCCFVCCLFSDYAVWCKHFGQQLPSQNAKLPPCCLHVDFFPRLQEAFSQGES